LCNLSHLRNTFCDVVTFCNNEFYAYRPAAITIVFEVPSLSEFPPRLKFKCRILIFNRAASLELRRDLDRLLMRLISDICDFLLLLRWVILMPLELVLFHEIAHAVFHVSSQLLFHDAKESFKARKRNLAMSLTCLARLVLSSSHFRTIAGRTGDKFLVFVIC